MLDVTRHSTAPFDTALLDRLMDEAGLDVLTISRRIGHASPAITLSVYGHWFKNTDAKAAEIIEAAFGRIGTE